MNSVVQEIALRCDAQDAVERLGMAGLLTWDQVRRALDIVWQEQDLDQLRREVVVAIACRRARSDEAGSVRVDTRKRRPVPLGWSKWP